MRKTVKRLAVGLSAFIGVISISGQGFAAESTPQQNNAVSYNVGSHSFVRAYRYEWDYLIINGVMHKRLYNLTLDRYEGDWIPM